MIQQFTQRSFINLFPTITDDNNYNILDIWNSFRVVVIPELYKADSYFVYRPLKADTLHGLAKKFYDDPNLWWIIPLVNDAEDPFDFLDDMRDNNESINILRNEYLFSILFTLSRMKNAKDNEITNDR
jgi:hypothetical protein